MAWRINDETGEQVQMISNAKRKKRGEDTFRELTGRGPDALRASMAGLAPDAAEYVVEVVYGEMYQRAGLDIKTRQIVTVAALAAMGNAQPQLRNLIRAARHAGWTEAEVVEVFMQLAPYCGVPVMMNGLEAARLAFKDLAPPAA